MSPLAGHHRLAVFAASIPSAGPARSPGRCQGGPSPPPWGHDAAALSGSLAAASAAWSPSPGRAPPPRGRGTGGLRHPPPRGTRLRFPSTSTADSVRSLSPAMIRDRTFAVVTTVSTPQAQARGCAPRAGRRARPRPPGPPARSHRWWVGPVPGPLPSSTSRRTTRPPRSPVAPLTRIMAPSCRPPPRPRGRPSSGWPTTRSSRKLLLLVGSRNDC